MLYHFFRKSRLKYAPRGDISCIALSAMGTFPRKAPQNYKKICNSQKFLLILRSQLCRKAQ